ncbi:hypothetical protein BJY24_002656 [Nocardia transvalensis]|uniref:Anti-sigma-M factor RsmA n=1 Tax=Nocardia transvalensis TaxID=37333 RepID=A0A7W9UHV9_9NOCA|nr:hypothetical protein [Nocardia transvalensis]MBB5913789.1 hypothetical protein [Nocardia transvalensis]
MDDKGEAARRHRPGAWDSEDDTGGAMASRSVPQPPFSTDLLADLHADNVAPELSGRLWPQVREDPESLRFLRSLDDVTAELQALGRDSHVLHPIPPDVSARLDRLLDDLAQGDHPADLPTGDQVATVHHLPYGPAPEGSGDSAPSTRPMAAVPEEDEDNADPAEPIRLAARRSRPLRWLTLAAAAVAVIAGTVVAVDAVRGRDTIPNAFPTKQTGAPHPGGDPTDAVLLSALGRNDVSGPLGAPGALAGCVTAAAGIDRTVLGSMDFTYQGRPAVVILLTALRPPKITALVVGPGCGPGDAQRLEMRDIG